MPVTHYPGDAAADILRHVMGGWVAARPDVAGKDGAATRPCYGIGGLVPALSPTQPRAVFEAADEWYTGLLRELEAATERGPPDSSGIDPALLQLHLFGIGRPAFVLRSAHSIVRQQRAHTDGPLWLGEACAPLHVRVRPECREAPGVERSPLGLLAD